MLSGCAAGPPAVQIVYRDKIIEKPVPIVTPVDARLLQPCIASYTIPEAGVLPLDYALARLEAVEYALDLCNNDKAELRKAARPVDQVPNLE